MTCGLLVKKLRLKKKNQLAQIICQHLGSGRSIPSSPTIHCLGVLTCSGFCQCGARQKSCQALTSLMNMN